MLASDWLGRALCLLITFGSAWAKHSFFQLDPTLFGVGISQCFSALFNASALLAAAYLIRGPASYDLQLLSFCAVVVNLLSFISFAAKNSPCVQILNHTITVISYVQFVRILWPSNGSPLDYCRGGLLHRLAYLSVASFHVKKEKS